VNLLNVITKYNNFGVCILRFLCCIFGILLVYLRNYFCKRTSAVCDIFAGGYELNNRSMFADLV
jgi:hypothetical protein